MITAQKRSMEVYTGGFSGTTSSFGQNTRAMVREGNRNEEKKLVVEQLYKR